MGYFELEVLINYLHILIKSNYYVEFNIRYLNCNFNVKLRKFRIN
jgi:hypothetical protein